MWVARNGVSAVGLLSMFKLKRRKTQAVLRKRYALVIGFDFGTSFSKVVVHEQNQRAAEVVTFSGGEWLFPSLIGLHQDTLYGPLSSSLQGPLTYLKMVAPQVVADAQTSLNMNLKDRCPLLSSGDAPMHLRNLLAWYFANVLSATLFFITHKSRWADFSPETNGDLLFAQVGVPSGYMSDKGSESCFLEAFSLGRVLVSEVESKMNAKMPYRQWASLCDAGASQAHVLINEEYCTSYPEVAAGVQCVLRSPTAEDGLYVTIDVGAGTVDMNAFLRHTAQGYKNVQERPNKLDYYAAKVEPYGVSRIKNRSNVNPYIQMGDVHLHTDVDWSLDPRSEMDVMQAVGDQIRSLLCSAFEYQPNHGIGTGLRTWDRCKVYAWGGGYGYAPYQATVSRVLGEVISVSETKRLPCPINLTLPKKADYSRLTIAYGLSHWKANMEDIRLPNELQTMDRPERKKYIPDDPREDGYFSKPEPYI